jgi:hypothetical protein
MRLVLVDDLIEHIPGDWVIFLELLLFEDLHCCFGATGGVYFQVKPLSQRRITVIMLRKSSK